MEAEDTVMGEGEVWAIMDGHYQGNEILKVGVNVAKRQAEISFKVGIREVFNWQHAPCPHKNESYFARDCAKCLQGKLKEWGLNEKV